MSKKDLVKELKDALCIFREIFKSTPKILGNIDDVYEEELVSLINSLPMPEDAIEIAMNAIFVAKSILGSIHFDELKTKLSTATFDLHLTVDIYAVACKILKSKIKDREIRGFVLSMVKKCRPIIDCASEVLENPLLYIDFLAKFRSTDYDDLLG